MEMDFVSTLVNYGGLGICLAYFIYKDNTTMKEFRGTLESLKDIVTIMKAEIDVKKEDKE